MSNWVPVRKYAAPYEAELDKQTLEQSGIPVMLKGPITGVFGPGFSGPTAEGVTLLVPGDDYDTAVDLLSSDDP